MKSSKIQWCDDTVNPISGCDGCELWIPGRGGPCYAGNLHETRLSKSLPALYDPIFTNVREIPGRMAKIVRCQDLTGRDRPDKPWLNGLRRKIFLGDLGDVFSAGIAFDFLKTEIIDITNNPYGSRHDLLMLTKQPNRAVVFGNWLKEPWPENVWCGTSITNKNNLKRIEQLRNVPATHRFLSLEPLVDYPELTSEILEGIDWIIIGGESDQGKHKGRCFHLDWVYKIIELGKKLEIAIFVKQFGSHPVGMNLVNNHGGDWNEWPEKTRVRQMPFNCR